MDSNRPPYRPRTIGQSWRDMNLPRGRKVGDLPSLPDWPPLPEENPRPDWPPLPEDDRRPDWPPRDEQAASSLQEDDQFERQRADGGEPLWPGRPPGPPRGATNFRTDLWSRWRGMSRRRQVGVVAAVVLPLLLIITCSSVGLSMLGAAGGSSSTPLSAALPTQQATGSATAPGSSPTVGGAIAAPTSTRVASQPLAITFTCASGSVRGTGSVCVHTTPSAVLNMTVRYCDGSYAKNVRSSAVADTSGNYTWSWPMHAVCAGAATATVTAKSNGQTITATKSFTVTA
ncbi:MAG TPA: hypothetical protein VE338_17795 [Ktedonobacterales bacterium]|nr:hypothetical protein [Ktedonobacterales bacterium]